MVFSIFVNNKQKKSVRKIKITYSCTCLRVFFLILFIFYISHDIIAEGTKEIQPTPGSHGRLQLMPHVTDFAIFDAAPEHRLHITICEPGEVIYYGFGYVRDYFGAIQNDVIYRIKDPSGNTVVGPASIPYTGQGFINQYSQAVNGPNIINPSGYNALSYTPLTTGDYYIEFSFTQPYGHQRKVFDLFDITVVAANNTVKNGRLWSKNWQLTTNPVSGYNSPYQAGYDGTMYIYADDGVVTSVDLNNMQPFVFNITANETGCFNTGDIYQDRKSTDGNHTYPQYRIFLNDPDSTCFPSGQLGNFTQPTTITGCPGDFCINIYVDKDGNIEVLLDLNGVPGYQPGTEDVIIAANVNAGHNCIQWDGLDGLGNPVSPSMSIPLEVNYFNGLTHLPIYDVEGHAHGFIVEVVRPPTPNPHPALFWDDTDIPGGTAELTGCTDPNGCHTWSIGNCLTNPVPPYCSLGDMRTINTWWYAHAIEDVASVNFEYPIVNANIYTPVGQNDTLICLEDSVIHLHGSIQYAPYGVWEGSGGYFAPSDTSLQAVYHFSQAELDAGYAMLVLNSYGGNCPDRSDTINITIVHADLQLSSDETICEGESVTLNASGGNTYTWSPSSSLSDAHTASPVASPQSSTTYTVSITDVNGCTAAGDMVVWVEQAPDIDFYPDKYEGCKPLRVDFSSLTSSTISQYTWDFGNTSAGNHNTSSMANPSHTYNRSGSFTVSLTVTSDNGCSNEITYPYLITVFPQPIPSFYTLPREGGPDDMLFSFFNESLNAELFRWDFGDENAGSDNTSTLENPQHQYQEAGTYEVWLTAISPDGCIDSISRNIIIRGEHTFYVPNAFTPDADGINDVFLPYGIEIDNNKFNMYIFNRWGELVFETDDVNKGWDGTVRNTANKAPPGVYVWLIYLQNDIVGRKKYVGHVSLLR